MRREVIRFLAVQPYVSAHIENRRLAIGNGSWNQYPGTQGVAPLAEYQSHPSGCGVHQDDIAWLDWIGPVQQIVYRHHLRQQGRDPALIQPNGHVQELV